MAELHSNPNVINPILEVDQQQVDKDYDQEKPEMLAATAIDEINATTGLSDIFNNATTPDRLDPASISRLEWRRRGKIDIIKNDFSTRINEVLTRSAVAYEDRLDSGNHATSAMLERTVWHHRRANVIDSIMNNRYGAEQSVNVAAGCLKFMTNVEEKIKSELQTEQERYAQDFEAYNKVWTVLSFGRKSREARFNTFSTEVSGSITNRLKELRERAKKIESTADTAVKSSSTNLTRRLKMAPATQKVAMWQQLQNAVNFNRTLGLGALDLSQFGITTDQAKINALEALARDPWLKEQVAAITESTARHQHQASLVKTAKDQETVLATPPTYTGIRTFADVEAAPAFAGLPVFEGAVTTQDLVDSLWRELYNSSGGAAPGNFPESLFSGFNVSHALLTPSVKLHVLLNHLVGGRPAWENARQQITAVVVRQKLLKFLTVKNKESLGSIEEYDDTSALESIRELQTNPDSAIERLSKIAQRVKSAKLSENLSIFTQLERDITSNSSAIQSLYTAFLNRESDIDPKDFKKITEGWKKVMIVRKYFDENAAKWVQDKKSYNGHEKDRVDDLEHRIATLEAEEVRLTALISGTRAPKETLVKRISNISSEISTAKNEIANLKAGRATRDLTNISELNTHLDTLNIETSTNWNNKIKPATPAYIPDFSNRLYESIKDNFAEEAEIQFLTQWAKNDQFEMLKSRKSGLVNVSFREVGALTRLTFPQELNGAESDIEFRIERSDSAGVCLVETAGARRRIRIVGPAVQAGNPPKVTKNAAVFSAATAGAVGGAATGNHPTEAIITNIKLSA